MWYLESPYNFLYTERGLNRNKRIYGGEQATAGTIPWIVTFVFGDPSDSLARCGGSIIGPNFVVTAAHCAYGQTPSSVNITAGTFSYSGYSLLQTEHPLFCIFLDYFLKE